jgi:hypothetical protein
MLKLQLSWLLPRNLTLLKNYDLAIALEEAVELVRIFVK